jgi:hypothetical protein
MVCGKCHTAKGTATPTQQQSMELTDTSEGKYAAYKHQFAESYGDNWTLGIVAEAIIHGRQRPNRDASHITRLLRELVDEKCLEAAKAVAERVGSMTNICLEDSDKKPHGCICWNAARHEANLLI